MSNRGYLTAASSPDPRATLDDDLDFTDTSEMHFLRTAGIATVAHSIPVLWCTLFEMGDVHRVEFIENGESDAFTVLVTSVDVAEERASASREPFLELFPLTLGHRFYTQWTSLFPLLREQDYRYIHFDMADLEALYDPHSFELFLGGCLGSLSTMSTEGLGMVLRQAGIGFDSDSRTAFYPLYPGAVAPGGGDAHQLWREIGPSLRGRAELAGLDWSG